MNTIMPAPGGTDLLVDIECTTDPRQSEGATHPVAIHADWTVMTVHELDGERVARSLGGWSSCLHFAETIVPAYRHCLRIMSDPTSLGRNPIGSWMNTSPPFCPGGHRHSTLREAVRHEIDGIHLARQFESDQWRFDVDSLEHAGYQQFRELMWVARPMWAAAADPRVVRLGVDGYLQLWREGLLPAHAETIAHRVPRIAWPLTVEFFVERYYEQLERPPRTGVG